MSRLKAKRSRIALFILFLFAFVAVFPVGASINTGPVPAGCVKVEGYDKYPNLKMASGSGAKWSFVGGITAEGYKITDGTTTITVFDNVYKNGELVGFSWTSNNPCKTSLKAGQGIFESTTGTVVTTGQEISNAVFCPIIAGEPEDITITLDKVWAGQYAEKPADWKVEAYLAASPNNVLATLSGNTNTIDFDIAPGTAFSIREIGVDDETNWAVTGHVGTGYTPTVDTTYTVVNTYTPPVEPEDITITLVKDWAGPYQVKPANWRVEAYLAASPNNVLATLSGNTNTIDFDIAPGTAFSIREIGVDDEANWAVTGHVGTGYTPTVDTTYTVVNTYTPPVEPEDITITLVKAWVGPYQEKPANWRVEAYLAASPNNVLATLSGNTNTIDFDIAPGTAFSIRELGVEGEANWKVTGHIGTGYTPAVDTTYTVVNTYRLPGEPDDVTITMIKDWAGPYQEKPADWRVEAYLAASPNNVLATLSGNTNATTFDIAPGTAFNIRELGVDDEANWAVTGHVGTGYTPTVDTLYTVVNTYTPPVEPEDITITLVKAWNKPANIDKPAQWQVRAYIAGNGEIADIPLATLSGDDISKTFDVVEGTAITIEETGVSLLARWGASGSLGVFTPTANSIYTVTNTYTAPTISGGGGTSFTARPDISVTKTANVGLAEIGDLITYTFVVRNTGNVSLTNVSLEDDQLGIISLGTNSLAVNGQITETATYRVLGIDAGTTIVNVAEVTGEYGNTTVSDTDIVRVTVLVDNMITIGPEPTEVQPIEVQPVEEVSIAFEVAPELLNIEPETLVVEPELPRTGGNGLLLMLAGLGAILAGGTMVRVNARKEG